MNCRDVYVIMKRHGHEEVELANTPFPRAWTGSVWQSVSRPLHNRMQCDAETGISLVLKHKGLTATNGNGREAWEKTQYNSISRSLTRSSAKKQKNG